MAVNFSVPASPKRNIITIDEFLGADFTNSPASADMNKSPNCENMIRDVPGKVRKCMGYELVRSYGVAQYDNDLFGSFVGEGKVYDSNNRSIAYIKVKEGRLKVHQICSLTGNESRTGTIYLKDIGDNTLLNQTSLAALYNTFGRDSSVNARVRFYPHMPKYNNTPQVRFFIEQLEDETYSIYLTCDFFSTTKDLSLRCRYNIGATSGTEHKINGFYKIRGDENGVYHEHNRIMMNNSQLYEGMNDTRSKGWEFDEHIYIVDGKKVIKP